MAAAGKEHGALLSPGPTGWSGKVPPGQGGAAASSSDPRLWLFLPDRATDQTDRWASSCSLHSALSRGPTSHYRLRASAGRTPSSCPHTASWAERLAMCAPGPVPTVACLSSRCGGGAGHKTRAEATCRHEVTWPHSDL